MEGRLDLGAFDRFSCVRIAYDAKMDRIRVRFNEIVDNAAHTEGEITEQNATPLNEVGRARLRELLNELGRDSI
jgi:hypothetical protein